MSWCYLKYLVVAWRAAAWQRGSPIHKGARVLRYTHSALIKGLPLIREELKPFITPVLYGFNMLMCKPVSNI